MRKNKNHVSKCMLLIYNASIRVYILAKLNEMFFFFKKVLLLIPKNDDAQMRIEQNKQDIKWFIHKIPFA